MILLISLQENDSPEKLLKNQFTDQTPENDSAYQPPAK